MTTPDLPNWLPNDHPDLPPRPDPDTPPSEATVAAPPPTETQIASPEDLVSVDEETGYVKDGVLPPPTMEDVGGVVGEEETQGEGEILVGKILTPEELRKAQAENPSDKLDEEGRTQKDPRNSDMPEDDDPPPQADQAATTPTEAEMPDTSRENGGGDGGGGEPPEVPRGEAGDDGNDRATELAEQCTRCKEDVKALQQHMADLGEIHSDPEIRDINGALLTLAAASKDLPEAHYYLDQVVNPTPEEQVEAYLIRKVGGDTEALPQLYDRIAEESREAYTALGSEGVKGEQPMFDTLMRLGEQQGLLPEKHIGYATSGAPTPEIQAADAQNLFLQHASRVMPAGGEYADYIRERVDAMAANITDDRLLEDGPYALVAVSDNDTKEELFNRYSAKFLSLDSTAKIAQGDISAVKTLFETAPAIAASALQGLPEGEAEEMLLMTVAMITIARGEVQRQSANIPPHELIALNDLYENGTITMMIQEGHSVEDVAFAARYLLPETPIAPRGNEGFGISLEALAAAQYVQRGEISKAQYILDEAEGFGDKLVVLESCWAAARTAEEMDMFKPPREISRPHPHIIEQFQYERAMRSDNKVEITEMAKKFADAGVGSVRRFTYAQAAGNLTQRLTAFDPAAGLKLADELLKKLHTTQHGIDVRNLKPFHDVLAQSGSPQHLSFVRTSIQLAGGPNAAILREFANLTRALTHATAATNTR